MNTNKHVFFITTEGKRIITLIAFRIIRVFNVTFHTCTYNSEIIELLIHGYILEFLE